jgi:hypothetical protein
MNARSFVPRLSLLTVLALAALLAGGCSRKAPDQANETLKTALDALHRGNEEAFIAIVLPAQQEEVTSKAEWDFFQAAKSHKIDNEFDLDVTDDAASIMGTLYFDDEQKKFSTLYFVMSKQGDKWYIDLDKTIRKERDADGTDAFQVWEFTD